jgi:hypothetical protein
LFVISWNSFILVVVCLLVVEIELHFLVVGNLVLGIQVGDRLKNLGVVGLLGNLGVVGLLGSLVVDLRGNQGEGLLGGTRGVVGLLGKQIHAVERMPGLVVVERFFWPPSQTV